MSRNITMLKGLCAPHVKMALTEQAGPAMVLFSSIFYSLINVRKLYGHKLFTDVKNIEN